MNNNPQDTRVPDSRVVGTNNPTASIGYGKVMPIRTASISASQIQPPPSPTQQPGIAKPPKPNGPRFTFTFEKYGRIAGLVVLVLLIIGVGIIAIITAAQRGSNSGQSLANAADRFDTQHISLSDIAAGEGLSLIGTRSLVINGPLVADAAFTISPSGQPSNANRGQIYYDQNDNQLAYYNGSQFVKLTSGVQTINGQTGAITVGQGLNVTNNQISNNGVLSLQGQTGNVTLTAGDGIVIDGTTISATGGGVTSINNQTGAITLGSGLTITGNQIRSTGIITAAAGSGITVNNDGNGNITISNSGAGSGTVSSPGGTSGRIAKFTGVQTIADSLLSETGTTVTVNGDLSVTGVLSLSSALTVGNGGTGTTALSANGVVIGNGSGALTAVTAGAAGQCLMSTAGAPAFQACPGGGGGVTSLNGLAGALSIANASGVGSTITIDNASTAQKGIAQFNSTNFTAASGTINTIQNINTTATPTFTGVNTNSINPSGALTVGATSQQFTLQGNASSAINATTGVNSTTVAFQSPTAAVTYRFATAAAGTYDICTAVGNCAGAGGGVTTAGGTSGVLPVFNGGQSLADSLVSQSGGTVTVTGNLNLTTGNQYRVNGTQISSANLSNDANLAKLNGTQTFTGVTNTFQNSADSALAFSIQNASSQRIFSINTTSGTAILGQGGSLAGQITLSNATNTNTVTIASAVAAANRTYTLPDVGSDATFCLSTGNCAGAGVTLQGAYNNSTSPEITVDATRGALTIRDASSPIGANLLEIQNNAGGTTYFAVTSSGTSTTGTSTSSGNINSSGGALQTGGTSRVDNTGNLINIANLTLSGAVSGGTTVSGSGNFNTTGGALQTNSTTRVDNSGNLTNIGNLTATAALIIASSGAGNDITIDGADQFIVQDAATFNALSTFTADVDMNLAETENVEITNTVTGTNSLTLLYNGIVNNTTSGTQRGQLIQNIGGSGVTEALLILDNGDTDTAVTSGLVLSSAAGGMTTAIDVSDPEITTALLFGANDITGTNFTVTGSSGNISSGGNATLQGGVVTIGTASQAGSLVIHDGSSNTGTLQLAALGQNTIYTLPDPGTGSVSICLTSGNCSGVGGGVTGTGTNNRLTKFTSTGSTVGDSTITDDGTTVTTTVDVVIQGGDLTVGTSSSLASLIMHDGNGQTTTLRAGDSAGNLTFILPTATGSANQCLKQSGTGNQLIWEACDGGSGGSSATLQQAYNNGATASINTTDARDLDITLTDTATDANFNITTADGSTGFIAFKRANGTGTADPAQILLIDNLDTDRSLPIGIKLQSAAGGMATAIDVTDAEIVDAISVAGNNILGTTGNIDFTNFDVTGATGNITTAGDLAVNGGDITSTGSITIASAGAGNDVILNSADTIELQDNTNVTGALSATGSINSSAGVFQTNGTTRLDNSGNLTNIGSLTLSGAISGGTTYSGSGNINTTGGAIQTNSTTRIDNSGNLANIGNLTATGAITISSSGAGNDIILNSADTIELQDATNITGTLGVTGVVTLGGGAAADITTATAATASALVLQPGISSAATGTGAALTLKGGDQSGTTTAVGGALTLQGGSATGGAGSRTGGDVNIDAGTGATANGAINIGTINSSTISIGRTTGGATINLGRSNGTYNLNIAGTAPSSTNTQTVNIASAGGQSSASTVNVNILSGAAGSNGTATLNLANYDRVTQVDIGNIVADSARTLNMFTGDSTAVDTINIGTGNTSVAGGKTINIGTGTPTGSGSNLVTIGSTALTSATTIQSGSGNINLQVSGASTIGRVQVGAGGAGSTTPDYLALDVKSTTGDPAGGAEGYMYYNTFDNKFRCYEGTGWTDCITASAANTFIQGGNSFSATAVLGTNDANALELETGGTTRLTVGATGGVTLAAGNTLTVTSALTSLTGATSGDALSVSNSTSTGNIAVFKDNTTAVFTIGDGGAVNIATNTTGTIGLTVAGTSGQTADLLRVNDGAGNTQVKIDASGTLDANYKPTTTGATGSIQLGSTANQSSNDINGTIGFWGSSVKHAQIAYSVGDGFYLCDSSAGSPGGDFGQCASRVNLYGQDANFNGTALFKTTSATALQVQDSSSSLLTVDTTARSGSGGNLVKIGNSTGTDTATTILQLDAATAAPTSNLAAINGGMFYNSTLHKVSIIENGTVKTLCNTTDLGCGTGGSARLDQITAATGNASINNAANNIVWNWQLSAAEVGMLFTENTASTGGGTNNQFVLQASTLSGSTASPLSIVSNSVDAADIIFNLNSAGDLQFQDAGTAFLTLSDTGAIDINLDATDNPSFTITNAGSGNVQIDQTSGSFIINDNSIQAFKVDSVGDVYIGKADSSRNVFIGDGTSTASSANLFFLDQQNTADPSPVQAGAMYYNSLSDKFRCYEASTWKNCVGLTNAPTTTLQNTVQPATSGVVGLTINGTNTGTAATALIVNQAVGTATNTSEINMTNTSGTQTNGLLVNRNGASGTTTNGINITNTAGTLTNGIAFTGTIGTDIFRSSGTLTVAGGSGASGVAGTAISVTTGGGGGSSSTTAGAGGALGLTTAAGGNATSSGTGGAGGALTITAGAGGTSSTGNGGAGGIITLQPGLGGIGGTNDGVAGRVQIGSTTLDSNAQLLVIDTKNTSGDPVAANSFNGGMYYNSNTHTFRCYRDSAWENCGANPIDRGFNFEDEFMSGDGGAVTNGLITGVGDLGWWLGSPNANASCTNIYNSTASPAPTPTHDHPGTLQLHAGNSNGGCGMNIGGDQDGGGLVSLNNVVGAGDTLKSTVALGSIATTNKGIFRFGWTNMADVNSITAPTSGAWFEYNQASSTTLWRYCYANNAAATCANTSAVSAATWTNLEIRIISSSAITFLINGSAVATLTGITYDGGATNKLGPEYVCAQGASSTTRFDCYIDYFQWRGVSSALR